MAILVLWLKKLIIIKEIRERHGSLKKGTMQS